jgi:hypothetical protein
LAVEAAAVVEAAEAARLAAEAEAKVEAVATPTAEAARLAAEAEAGGEAAAASESMHSSRGIAAAAAKAATHDQPCFDCAAFSERAECRAWADAGECRANAVFMRDACRESCGACCAQAAHAEL